MIKFALLLLGVLVNTKTVFYWTYLWQVKEYRLDRVLSHLRSDTDKKIWLPFYPYNLFYYPKFTFRAILVIVLSLLLPVGTWLFVYLYLKLSIVIYVFALIVIDRLTAFATAFSVFLSLIPVAIAKERVYKMAKQKAAKLDLQKVIGITGSFGKTSTKEFMATILSEKYRTAKTRDNNNTKIGVAQNILREIKADTEVFVAEIGAYKRGEITDVTKLIRPQIAVITGINYQHLDIFGSLKNLIEAKYELIRALPENGLAVFNADNKHSLRMAERARKEKTNVIVYSIKNIKTSFDTFMVKDIKIKGNQTSFRMTYPGGSIPLNTSVFGGHQISNIAASVVVAKLMGLSDKSITAGVDRLKIPPQALRIFRTKSRTVIDDSYSANPDGFIAALESMSSLSGKKAVITRGMIELGKAKKKAHLEVASRMVGKVDLLVLLNKSSLRYFVDILKNTKTKIVVESDPAKIFQMIVSLGPGSVVLLESRVPDRLKDMLGAK